MSRWRPPPSHLLALRRRPRNVPALERLLVLESHLTDSRITGVWRHRVRRPARRRK